MIANHNKLKGDTETKQYHLKAINELTFYAIEKQDEHLQRTLLEFYHQAFSVIRRDHDKNKPLVCPVDLYLLVNRLCAEAVDNRNRSLKAIEHRAVSGTWLLGMDYVRIAVSEETYHWLWRSLYIICDNTRLVKMYWENASQYCNHRLGRLSPDYDYQRGGITNQEEIEKRNQERKRFMEFNYALGGLLLYRQQYESVKYTMEFTQLQPPSYPMLPESMTSLFEWFEHFRNEFKSMPLDKRYSSPGLDHLGNVGQIRDWVCSYVALLFVRQYTLHTYYMHQDHTGLPNLPNDVIEVENWLNMISYFKQYLEEIVNNRELLDTVGYADTVEEKDSEFDQFVEDLKSAITHKIDQKNLNAQLSDQKIQTFYNTTRSTVKAALDEYKDAFKENANASSGDDLALSVNGGQVLMPKSAFTDHDLPIHGYDNIFARQIASEKIKQLIPNAFTTARTKRYLLNKDNVVLALSKITSNNKEAVIAGINTNDELRKILSENLPGLTIIHIPSTAYYLQNKLYVMRKSDLPTIEHRNLKKDEIERLKLKKIEEDLNLYASVIDLNEKENVALRNEWNLGNDINSRDLKVQVAIAFLFVIRWKNDRKVIQIDIASQYKEQGIQNDVNEIEPLEDFR